MTPPDSRRAERRAAVLCFALGAWGVLTGFALFLLLVEQFGKPWVFVAALAIAVAASYLIEAVRHVIEEEGEGPPAGPRVISTVLLIVIAELFVGALEALPDISPEVLGALGDLFLGDLAASLVPPAVSLLAVALVWMGVGGLIAVQLLQDLQADRTGKARFAHGALRGAIAGAVVAPLALLFCVVLLRVLAHAYLLVGHYEAWVEHLEAIGSVHPLLQLAVGPVKWLGALWTGFAWGPYAVGALVALGVWSLRREWPIAFWLVYSAFIVLLLPLLADLVDLLWIMLLAATVWAVPTAAIGAFAPLLRKPSDDTRTWGGVALAGAVLLTLLTVLRLSSWWVLIPAAMLALTAVLMRRGRAAEEWWPLLAMTAALVVAGVTWVFQQATFGGVFERVHAISTPDFDVRPALSPLELPPGAYTVLQAPRRPMRNPFEPEWTNAWQPDAVYRSDRSGMDRAYVVVAKAEKPNLGPRILSIRRWHAAFLEAERLEGLARLDRLRELQRQLRGEMSPQPGRLSVAITQAGRDRETYLRHAERVVGSDMIELRGASAIVRDALPEGPRELAMQLATATFGAPRWRVPGLREIAVRAKERLARQVDVVEALGLERFRPRPGMDIAALDQLGARLAQTPWQTASARAAADRRGQEIQARLNETARALDARLRAADTELETLPLLERVSAADHLLEEIRHAGESIGPHEENEQVVKLRKQLARLTERVEGRRDVWRARNKRQAVRLLELAICGSLGFWVSVGLLGGWVLRRRQP